MISPDEMINEIKKIKEAINLIEFRGEQNANYVLFSCQKCDFLVNAITEVMNARKKDTVEAGE